MEFLEKVTFVQLGFLTVINYIMHYAEEGPYLVAWIEKYCPLKNLTYSQKKLNLENLLYFGFALAGALLLARSPGNLFFQAMVFSVACAFVGNTWFHVKPTLLTRIYSPGVVSSSLFNQIICLLLFLKAWQGGIFTFPFVALTLVLGVGVFPLVVYVSHNVLLKDEHALPWLETFPVPQRREAADSGDER
ncbi:MAG: HXXEE domain-containing protein [Candidatus Eremiobacteraeota bacterium]|nr:HXXEE domain-containing protein [Candidatus Eremiobacteraeota bacterium]